MTHLRQKMNEDMLLRGLAESTRKLYLRAVKDLARFTHKPPDTVADEELRDYLLYLVQERRLASSSYNVVIYGLKFFYTVTLGRASCDMDLPITKQPSQLPDILSASEVECLLKGTHNLKYKTLFALIYSTGMRASEALQLRITDIDSGRMLIHIRRGKNVKDRYTLLSPVMLTQLRRYWLSCKPHDWLFPGRCAESSLRYRCAAYAYTAAKARAGLTKVGCLHALRHAYATHLLEAGINIYTIKQLLGHSSIVSTTRYIRLTSATWSNLSSPLDALQL